VIGALSPTAQAGPVPAPAVPDAAVPDAAVPDAAVAASAGDTRATDQIIVRYRPGTAPDTSALSREAGEAVSVQRRIQGGAIVSKLGARRSGRSVEALARRWASLPGVEYAEPDRILKPSAVPTDPSYVSQWDLFGPTTPALGSTLVGANLEPAWTITTGSPDVVVAVLDTGITAHADLAGQAVPGYDFISDAQIGNDGSARDANPSDPGDWISSTENASGFFAGCGTGNSSWHGTHVAGTIAAATNNGLGVAGIAPSSKILPVRVLGKCGGYTSDIVDGMRWAAGLAVTGVPANPNPAAVLNLSLGGSGACSVTQQSAIDDITAVGATVVVAAGNSNVDASASQPANCSKVITVAATGSTGSRAYYSNYGSLIELAGPGGDSQLTPGTILSTLNAGLTTPSADSYVGYQGTSMATPHVAGVAALVKAVRPSTSASEMVSILQSTSAVFPTGSTCTTALCGTGMLDAAAAVTAASAGGPRTLGAFSKTAPLPGTTGIGTSTTLQWTPSAGATSYEYCLVVGLSTPCTTWTAVGTATYAVVSGLSGTTVYAWQVRAVLGTSSAEANVSLRSSFTTATPVALPVAFAKTSPATAATGQAVSLALSWAASTGATSYEYCLDSTINSACDGTWVSTGTARTATVSALLNSTKYEWQVRARNAGGTTDASAGVWWTFTTVALPIPGAFAKTSPTNNQTGRATTLALSWGASTSATSYEYCLDRTINSACDGTWVSTGTARTATVSALVNSTKYEWQVRARAAGGTTNASAGVWWTFTTVALPLPGAFNKTSPSNNLTRRPTTLTLSWGASTGAVSYEVCLDKINNSVCDGTWTSVGTSRSATANALTRATSYYWQVRAVNAAGVTNANSSVWWKFVTA
jgi:serine protease